MQRKQCCVMIARNRPAVNRRQEKDFAGYNERGRIKAANGNKSMVRCLPVLQMRPGSGTKLKFCMKTYCLPALCRTRAPSCLTRLLIVSTLAAGIIRPASATLRVRNDVRHAEQWFRLYDDLPRAWKTRRAVLLREMSERDIARLAGQLGADEGDRNGDSVIDGCYQNAGYDDNAPPLITVCDTLRGEQAGLVFAHEYGHFVWNELLSDEQRARYTRLWRSQKRAHHLITEYARDSDEEGFAEAFAYYARHASQLTRKDPASAQFLRDLSALRLSDDRDGDNTPDSDGKHPKTSDG